MIQDMSCVEGDTKTIPNISILIALSILNNLSSNANSLR